MRTADLEADGFVRYAFVCTSDAFCLLQDLLPHLLEVIEALAYSSKGTCLCLISQRVDANHDQSQSVRAAAPGKCRNSPQSLPAELDFTSCRTKGLLVQISGPLGKKSLPTWSTHDHHNTLNATSSPIQVQHAPEPLGHLIFHCSGCQ